MDEYRASMHKPTTGVMFHDGSGERLDTDKLAQRVIRPAVEAIGLRWYGWHGFRRGIASNLYALGPMKRPCSGFCAMPIRTLLKNAISRLSIRQFWRRWSVCRRAWRCWNRVQQ